MIALLKKIKRKLMPLYYQVHQAYFSIIPAKVQCNICGYRANHLQSDVWHQHAICPRCESGVRQRLLWATIMWTPIQQNIQHKKILHFAPDHAFGDKLKKLAGEYKTADYFAEGYQYPHIDFDLDISRMPSIANQSYDCVIACDVLEHVADDKAALQEIKRVLKPGGCCILTVPQKDHLAVTDEDPNITHPAEREKRFGQSDHLRIYGNDFTNRISAAGFTVQVINEKDFSESQVKTHVLFPPVLSKHPMATNYRKIFIGQA